VGVDGMASQILTEGVHVDTVASPLVELHEAQKAYRVGGGLVHALRPASVQVQAGEFVCLMGPSGSGKTTMLYLMGGLERPSTGLVKVAGHDTTRFTEGQFAALRHSTIGFIFQSFNLLPFLSAVENVELPLMFERISRTALRERALGLLDEVGLGHRCDHRPGRLSAGEQQRVAVARALISKPSVLLADEPTANLDRASGSDVISILLGLCASMDLAVVAATHDPAVAEKATRVIEMADGNIVSQ
jgi:putative ABC transport system ATP-binding protein